MNILQQKLIFFQEASRWAPKQIKKLFQFGLEAFALQPITSLRAKFTVDAIFLAIGQDESRAADCQ